MREPNSEEIARVSVVEEMSAPVAGSSLVQLFAAILGRWRTILGVALAAMVAAFALSFFRTEMYTASTVLLMQQDADAPVDGLAGRLPAMFGGGGGGGANARLVGAVLGSRTLADTLANRVGRAAKREVLGDLERGTTLVINISDPDPVQAAQVANAYAEVVNEIVAQITDASTRQKQDLLVQQVGVARQRLEEAEQRTVDFQLAQDAPELQEQARLSLAAAVQLQQEIRAKEIQITQLRRTATAENPELRRLQAELGAQREQLRLLLAGSGEGNLLPAIRESPELKLASGRLLREYTEAEAVYSSLAAALAQTQIAANNRLPVLTVLDPAHVPSDPSGRGRGFLMVLAGVLGLVLGVAFTIVSEYLRIARADPRSAPLYSFWTGIRNGANREADSSPAVETGRR